MIIDAHVHTFPDNIAGKAIGRLAQCCGLQPQTDGTVGDTLDYMQCMGVTKFLSLNIATTPRQQHDINTIAAQNNAAHPQMISLGSVHPASDSAVAEVFRIHSLGIKGVKLHPDYQGVMIDDESLFPIYDACAELGLPIVFHAGWDCFSPELIHAPAQRSSKIARTFPKLKMVLAHLGGLHIWQDVQLQLAGLENVWFDTAMCATLMPSPQLAMDIIRRHPIERVLLGSDCPWESPQRSIEFVQRLPLTQREKDAILGENARALFHI